MGNETEKLLSADMATAKTEWTYCIGVFLNDVAAGTHEG